VRLGFSGWRGGTSGEPITSRCVLPHPGSAHDSRQGRQVLDCGDGVCEVTALALVALETPELAAHTASPPQSGDSEDSVAAVQNTRARIEVHGRNAPPKLEVEALHEPSFRNAGFMRQEPERSKLRLPDESGVPILLRFGGARRAKSSGRSLPTGEGRGEGEGNEQHSRLHRQRHRSGKSVQAFVLPSRISPLETNCASSRR